MTIEMLSYASTADDRYLHNNILILQPMFAYQFNHCLHSYRNAKAGGKTKGKGKGGKRESIKEEEKEEELKHPVDAITVSSVTSEEMKLFRLELIYCQRHRCMGGFVLWTSEPSFKPKSKARPNI